MTKKKKKNNHEKSNSNNSNKIKQSLIKEFINEQYDENGDLIKIVDLSNTTLPDNYIKDLGNILEKAKSSIEGLDISNVSDNGKIMETLAKKLKNSTKIKIIRLPHCPSKIGDEFLEIVISILHNCSNIHTLDLGDNNLSSCSEDVMSEFLIIIQNNPNIKHLFLSNTQLDMWMGELDKSLEKCRSLRTLDFNWNELSNSGVNSLINILIRSKDLETLSLRGIGVFDKNYKKLIFDIIGDRQRKIKDLDLYIDNESNDDLDFEDIASRCNSLKILNTGYVGLQMSFNISEMISKGLEELKINTVSPADALNEILDAMGKSGHITKLGLKLDMDRLGEISDKLINAVKKSDSLTELELRGTEGASISDKFLKNLSDVLKTKGNVKKLYLKDWSSDPYAVQKLLELVSSNLYIEEIETSEMNASDMLHLIKALKMNSNINYIDFHIMSLKSIESIASFKQPNNSKVFFDELKKFLTERQNPIHVNIPPQLLFAYDPKNNYQFIKNLSNIVIENRNITCHFSCEEIFDFVSLNGELDEAKFAIFTTLLTASLNNIKHNYEENIIMNDMVYEMDKIFYLTNHNKFEHFERRSRDDYINTQYWYSDNDIGRLIERNLQNMDGNIGFQTDDSSLNTMFFHSNQESLSHLRLGDGRVFRNGANNTFSILRGVSIVGDESIMEAQSIMDGIVNTISFAITNNVLDNHVMLFPYNSGGHWGLGRVDFSVDENNQITPRITVYDPLGPSNAQIISEHLKIILNRAYLSMSQEDRSVISNIVVSSGSQVVQQQDGTSCGVITVENINAILTNNVEGLQTVYSAGAYDARLHHVQISDASFLQNQANNIDWEQNLRDNDQIDQAFLDKLISMIERDFANLDFSEENLPNALRNAADLMRNANSQEIIEQGNHEIFHILFSNFADHDGELRWSDDAMNYINRAEAIIQRNSVIKEQEKSMSLAELCKDFNINEEQLNQVITLTEKIFTKYNASQKNENTNLEDFMSHLLEKFRYIIGSEDWRQNNKKDMLLEVKKLFKQPKMTKLRQLLNQRENSKLPDKITQELEDQLWQKNAKNLEWEDNAMNYITLATKIVLDNAKKHSTTMSEEIRINEIEDSNISEYSFKTEQKTKKRASYFSQEPTIKRHFTKTSHSNDGNDNLSIVDTKNLDDTKTARRDREKSVRLKNRRNSSYTQSVQDSKDNSSYRSTNM